MKKIIADFTVISNRGAGTDSFILKLSYSSPLPEILPGQFAEVLVERSPETFLRRPISVFDVDYGKNQLELLIQVVGPGTKALSELEKGASLNMVLPLGNSFTLPDVMPSGKVLLIGGGVGIAPLLMLGKALMKKGIEPEFILGFRNKERIIGYERFTAAGRVHITTEDGSAGEKGFVTSHSVLKEERIAKIYSCGPDPMMKAVAGFAYEHDIDCEVSLEQLMACGIGVCLCCVVDTSHGRVCTCTDGPVFNIKTLKWQTSQ